MGTTILTKIILERDGEERVAVPVSDLELASASGTFQALGLDSDDCSCGDEICHDGFVWRCAYGPSGKCQWFKSDWICQP